MDSQGFLPGIRGLKITLVAGLALLTIDALFAQSADQSSMDSLKSQMDQMQRQYEQHIEAMEAKMKALESNANSGSLLNTRVLSDADGKAVAPTPMSDESFLKSLTRNFVLSAYLRSGVGINGNGGPQDFSFRIPENVGGRWRLGNENDTYMELTWKQAHLLGDSPDVMDVAMTFTPAIEYLNDKTTFNDQFSKGAGFAMRQAFIEAKDVFKSAPEVTFWAGQRFYDRHDIHIHDYFFDDYSGYGLGVDNIDLGFARLLLSYLGGIRDDIAESNGVNTTVTDPLHGGFYMHSIDVRLHDIDLFGGKLELLADYQFFKGGVYAISGPSAPSLNIGDTSGGRWGAIYQHPLGKNSFWQIAAIYGIGASEIMGTDPNAGAGGNGFPNQGFTGGTAFAGYNFNRFAGNINSDGSVSSGSLRRATRFRGNGQIIWNVSDNFALSAAAFYEYDDQGSLSAEFLPGGSTVGPAFRTTGGSRNTVGVGIRPVFWVTDWLALQGQAGWDWTSRDRVSSLARNPDGSIRNDTFGKSGSMGIFSIAPTIKPKGGFFTRPEFRVFATYAIWSNSLKGAIGGADNGSPTYNNSNQGWLFGVQTEWFF
jgi:maltoporin